MAVPVLYPHLLHSQLTPSRLPLLCTMRLPGCLRACYIILSPQLLQEIYTFLALSVTVVWLTLNFLNGTVVRMFNSILVLCEWRQSYSLVERSFRKDLN